MSDGGDDLMTVADVARILRLNQQTVYNWVDRGELAALHVGRRVRIRREDFEAMVEAGYTGRTGHQPQPGLTIWDGYVPAPVMPDTPT